MGTRERGNTQRSEDSYFERFERVGPAFSMAFSGKAHDFFYTGYQMSIIGDKILILFDSILPFLLYIHMIVAFGRTREFNGK